MLRPGQRKIKARLLQRLDPARVGVGKDFFQLHRLVGLRLREGDVDRALHQLGLDPADAVLARALGDAQVHDLRRGGKERVAVQARRRGDHGVDRLLFHKLWIESFRCRRV